MSMACKLRAVYIEPSRLLMLVCWYNNRHNSMTALTTDRVIVDVMQTMALVNLAACDEEMDAGYHPSR